MPIEIRELHIKVNVRDSASERPMPEQRQRNAAPDRNILVDLCVEKVLEVLKQKSRR